jgi:selenocysteine lyase/cysteine desulfurase
MNQLIYLDNAATTFPKPETVYIAADTFYRTAGANAGRGQTPLARKAAQLVAEVRS